MCHEERATQLFQCLIRQPLAECWQRADKPKRRFRCLLFLRHILTIDDLLRHRELIVTLQSGNLWCTPFNSNSHFGQADQCKVFLKMCQLWDGETTLSVSWLYIICEHWLYTVSLILSLCLGWSLLRGEKIKINLTAYVIIPWEIKAVNTFYQQYQFLTSVEGVTAQAEITWLKRNIHCHLPQAEALLWTKETPANPHQDSRRVPLPECLWWRREAHSQGTARARQGRCELWSKLNTPGMSVLSLYFPIGLLCRAQQKYRVKSDHILLKWTKDSRHGLLLAPLGAYAKPQFDNLHLGYMG